MKVVAYHGVDSADHAHRVNLLREQHCRPIALAVAGTAGALQYSATWIEAGGPDWREFHDLDAAQYQQQFNTMRAQGFAPILIAATGPRQSARFAAVFAAGVPGRWVARHDLPWGDNNNPDSLCGQNVRADAEGLLPKLLAVYGDAADRRFAGVWFERKPVPGSALGLTDAPPLWSWYLVGDADHQRRFEASVKARLRPTSVAPTADGMQLAVYRDDQVGEWVARHGLNAAAYQAEFDAQKARGLFPVALASAGAGNGTRYSAIFAGKTAAVARVFSTTGMRDAALAGVDDLLKSFMRDNGIRAGAVCARRAGKVAILRGYTWAEPGYPQTLPDTPFRLASLSKLFTCAAVDWLVSAGKLHLGDSAFGYLGVPAPLPPGAKPDPKIGAITIGHLVNHNSGMERGIDHMTIAKDLGLSGAPSQLDILRWVYCRPLLSAPGSAPIDSQYSNLGYGVLTAIVEKAAQQAFPAFVQDKLLQPLGLNRLWLGRTERANVSPQEAIYECASAGQSCFFPKQANAYVAASYGADFVLENTAGAGGLVASAPVVARFIGDHAVWGLGGRTVNGRNGRLTGTWTVAGSLANGYDYACLFNRWVDDAPGAAFTSQLGALLV